MEIFFSLFAYFSSPRFICMCGKLSELLVKYPLSCGYEFSQHFLLWVGPIDDVDMRTVARGFLLQ